MNFIHEEYLDDLSICDKLIEYHKNGHQQIGTLSYGKNSIFNPNIKDSIDVAFQYTKNEKLYSEYIQFLGKVVKNYIDKFPYCNIGDAWEIVENINIQYYKPGGGFKVWHSERLSKLPPASERHLAFMTYLNDVTDQGGTEFYHQKYITQARKGLTLIWPVDWTHTHRGVVSPTQEKYIITGWFSFIDKK